MTEKVVECQAEEPQQFVRYCVMCGCKFVTPRPDAILCSRLAPCWTRYYDDTQYYDDTHDEDGEPLYDGD